MICQNKKKENENENETNSIRNSLRIQIVSFALIGLLVCCCRYPPTADCVLVCVCACVFASGVNAAAVAAASCECPKTFSLVSIFSLEKQTNMFKITN